MAKKTKAGSTAPAATDDERDVPQAEKDAVSKLLGEIERAKTIRKKFDTETLPKLRQYSWGTKHAEQGNSESTTRTNLIFATMATLLPHIYAKNPEIAVAPTEAVGPGEYEKIKDFCKTAQVMLNNLFIEEAKLKRRMKSNARSAMATSVGWIKMSFQKSLAGDPIIVRRANDMQDNLRKIEYLVSCADKETDPTTLNQQRAELQQQLKTLMDSPEMKVFKGFALDRVPTEDIFILDESIIEFDDYVSAKKIAHRVWMTDEVYAETFGHTAQKGAVKYAQPAPLEVSDDSGAKVQFGEGQKANYRAVFEVWDLTSNSICCVCEGAPGYARHPYPLKPASERWYSFFALGFNVVEGRWRPLSDVELLMKLQDEYNTTRYLFAETRKEAIPTRVFRKAGGLTEEDIKNLTNRRTRDFIGVEGSPTVPLNQDIMQLEGIKIDPAAFDVTIIRNDMDMLVGLSDASRSNLIQAKTATEAEIMRQALMTRVAERQDTIEDLTAEMATAALEIMMQEFSEDEVKQIAGDGAVWPQMDTESIFRKVRVSVRAGSTGKPNILKERESWAAIMPIINDTITQVMELRIQGQFDLANSKIELLKETLTRYDEKIDVDRFIPKQEIGEDGKPTAQANAIAQAAQAQEQFQALQEEHAKLQEENQKLQQDLVVAKQAEGAKIADIEANKAIAAAQESARQAESEAKTASAAAEAQAKADAEVRKAKDKLESDERIAQGNREQKEYEALVDAATKLIAARIAAEAKPAEGEDGAGAQKPQAIGPEQIGTMMQGFMAELREMAKAMQAMQAGTRTVEVRKDPDGVTRGTSVLVPLQ
jgi:hypothetical protein